MNLTSLKFHSKSLPTCGGVFLLLCVFLCSLAAAQENSGEAKIESSIGNDGTGTIIVEARGNLPAPPVLYTATANASAEIHKDRIHQTIQLAIKVVQGNAKSVNVGLTGTGEVTSVESKSIVSWSVRQVGSKRFIDLQFKKDTKDAKLVVKVQSRKLDLPASVTLTHMTPGESIGFDSRINLKYAPDVQGTVAEAKGFAPLGSLQSSTKGSDSFQTTSGGLIKLSLRPSNTSPAAVELTNTTLKGDVHSNGKSIQFQLRGTATVTEPDTEVTILSGKAAVSAVPSSENYRLRLSTENKQPVYKLVFPKAGEFPLELDFVATLAGGKANANLDFTVAASAVVPLTINGLDKDLQFHRDQNSVVPQLTDNAWVGFLPATGRAHLQWKSARKTGEGKLFFTTTGLVETQIGAGLLRQDHQIDFQVLQGELNSINISLRGPGEILDVQGSNIVAWKVTGNGDERQLDVTLSQPITSTSQIKVRSQTPLGAFPVRVTGLSLNPTGAIRHSGFLRLSNLGSVRLEPTDLSGLTQLAPEQYPGAKLNARQLFVYRFPAANHEFTIAADRIQPEVNISQLVLFQLAEADRVLKADIELDVREAPIREWDFEIPEEYSVVSATGASVADYITATETADGRRNLKVVFGKDISGRQLVSLHLEKSEPASAGDWVLPQIEYPEAKTVRGDIGIIGAAGYRIAVKETNRLAEKPLSYFPKAAPGLQQAFRIREPGWSATMRIELLDRSVQSDVFHLYSLSQETVYGSALINYFVTGAPVSEWKISVPATLGNVMVDGQDVRTWRREDDTLIVTLHQPVMDPYTLLVTFEEKPSTTNGTFQAGQITPLGVQGERGYIQVVSPMQVETNTVTISDDMLKLDPLELPAEFRLLSTAPALGTWQYTQRPFKLDLKVNWFQPGTMATQIVEFSEANSRVSQDGELVTEVLYYVKSRGRRSLKIRLPAAPVRLWEVSVNGQPVTARRADNATLIPLPGGTDPNTPMEVRLRLGKPTVSESSPELSLPVVYAPVLKTQWNIAGDEKHVLVPNGGTVSPTVPVLRPSGFDWVARRGLGYLLVIGVLAIIGAWLRTRNGWVRLAGLASLIIAVAVSWITADNAFAQTGSTAPLQLSLPILSAGESVDLNVKNTPLWRADMSMAGLFFLVAGIAAVIWSFVKDDLPYRTLVRGGGVFLIILGVLLHGAGAPWFFILLGLSILILFVLRLGWELMLDTKNWLRDWNERRKEKKLAAETEKEDAPESSTDGASGPATATSLILALALSFGSSSFAADALDGFETCDAINQQWKMTQEDARLTATGQITLTGKPGDQFVLLKSPSILTRFEGKGLRLSKMEVAGTGLCYVMTITESDPIDPENDAPKEGDKDVDEKEPAAAPSVNRMATFEYLVQAVNVASGVRVLTGAAAVQEIELTYDEADREVVCATAARIESMKSDDGSTKAKILLGPGEVTLQLKPKARDVSSETTQFFVEASNFYLPGPGVVDGRHRVHIRTSQGQVDDLNVVVPSGLTVSSVEGPVGSWQFDADTGRLKLDIEPSQSKPFNVVIETQRGLEPLPTDLTLAPLKVVDANGEVGLVAVAFGPDAQPEKLEPQGMSAVNLGDFDASLIKNKQAVLHRVYRYGADGGELTVRVAPVKPEVRVISKQVVSLGDERVVLGINFATEITRAGLFQLSFPLPNGLEIESLTGPALHHWAELTENDQRRIILHLNGKTIGAQTFSLTLSGPSPTGDGDWELPRFEINEANRQSGELVVRPTTGIRLRTVTRQNVSETDPRSLGGNAQGALAFRLLQRDWKLTLGIEKLDPWVTGQVLHEVALREGQTRSTLIGNFNIQNASIRTLKVMLPITDDGEIKTLRATGETVSDFVRTAPNSNVWEVQFKRRVVGRTEFRIEYERRGDRQNEDEPLMPAEFPDARQISYYFAVRAGGRLELEHDGLSQGWQRADWNTIPQPLRESGNRNAPALSLRAVAPTSSLKIHATRHSLADALKLRVSKGSLTTVLSPTGDQLTAVDVTMDVIQRSSLSVGLPAGGELFSIFVNGESVNSIRLGGAANAWQFYILPGIDDRTANVRFVYSVPGDDLSRLELSSPRLNVPLENIQWNVVVPDGFELVDNDGNLELVRRSNQKTYDRRSYLSKTSGSRQIQAQQAAKLLDQANQLLQAGEQTKARWALNSVANQYALDAASNEDARVQLENLQTQQAIVGLNTRRQRIYLDNESKDAAIADNKQLREAAAVNPILQQDALNFRPQELSQLLRGNTREDNAVLQQIATRLVQHQHTTEPAPQAIIISLPEEGSVYTFGRTVQVAENAPLKLDLDFRSQLRLHVWRILSAIALLAAIALMFTFFTWRESAR